jgi:hypothetical protein
MTQREALASRRKVMKLKGRDAAAVAAHAARPTCLLDEQSLDRTPTAGDGLSATPGAPIATLAAPSEYGHAVPRTLEHQLRLMLVRCPAPLCPLGLEAKLRQPMPNRCLAETHRLAYLACRHARIHQSLQFLPPYSSPRGMLLAIRSLQPVFLDPVADRRFVQADAPADLSEGQALA